MAFQRWVRWCNYQPCPRRLAASPVRFLLHPKIPAPESSSTPRNSLPAQDEPLHHEAIALPNYILTPNRPRKTIFCVGFDTNFLLQKLIMLTIFSYAEIFCSGGTCDSPMGNYCACPMPNCYFPWGILRFPYAQAILPSIHILLRRVAILHRKPQFGRPRDTFLGNRDARLPASQKRRKPIF